MAGDSADIASASLHLGVELLRVHGGSVRRPRARRAPAAEGGRPEVAIAPWTRSPIDSIHDNARSSYPARAGTRNLGGPSPIVASFAMEPARDPRDRAGRAPRLVELGRL